MAINIEDLTNASVVANGNSDGTGVFDKLMDTTVLYLEDQYTRSRLKGTDYANVLTATIPAVLQQAIEFLLIDEKVKTEQLEQQALKAKIEDENGMVITGDSIAFSTSPETQHHWIVEKLKQEETQAENQAELTAAQTDKVGIEADMTAAKTYQEYNYKPAGYTFTDRTMTASTTPKTILDIELLKSIVESEVGQKTADGYEADAYYKQFKSLYELLFALGNAGIIDTDIATNDSGDLVGMYGRIVKGMEIAMNNQTKVWAGDTRNTGGIDLDNSGTVE